MTRYEAKKKWKSKHPRTFREMKKRNYRRGAGYARNSGNPWGKNEDLVIVTDERTDRKLAEELGRTVQAIQIRRTRIQHFLGE